MFLRRFTLRLQLLMVNTVAFVGFLVTVAIGTSQDLEVVALGFITVSAAASLLLTSRLAGEASSVTKFAEELSAADASYDGSVSSLEVDALVGQLAQANSDMTAATSRLVAARRRAEVLARENEGLYRVERRVAEGTKLANHLAHRLAGTMDVKERLRIVAEAITAAAGSSGSLLGFSTNAGTEVISLGVDVRPHESADLAETLPTLAGVGRALETERVTFLDDLDKEALSPLDIDKAWVVPLSGKEAYICFLVLLGRSPTAPQELDLSLLNSLARYAAVEIENAYLYDKTARANEDAGVLLESSMWITESISARAIMRRVLDTAIDLVHPRAAIMIWKQPGRAASVMARNAGQDRESVGPASRLQEAAILLDAANLGPESLQARLDRFVRSDDDRPIVEALAAEGISDCLYLPLVLRGKGVGSLWLLGKQVYSDEQRSALVTIVNIAATALGNAQSYERKHRISEVLQRGLLPSRLPVIDGVELAAFYTSATEEAYVGGDFYDVIPSRGGKFAVLLGDVCGKGVEAARTSGMVKEICSYLLLEHDDPATVFSEANKAICARGPRGSFVTAFLAMVDIKKGEIRYANAGHPPALLVRPSGKVELLVGSDVVLGAIPGYRYDDCSWQARTGDKLVLYSDGVTEARDSGDLFGEERLVAAAALAAKDGSQEFVDILTGQIKSFSGGRLNDDVAIVVCRFQQARAKRKAA